MSGAPQDDRVGPGLPRLAEISDGVFAYVQPDGSWWINNTGLIVSAQGATSIDTCSTEARTRAYRQAIAGVTDRPVRLLVNTHHHGDHTFGNYLFDTATIVAHDQTRAEMLAFGLPHGLPFWDHVDWGGLRLDPPFLTYSDAVTLHAGELLCQVRHVGTPAHTTNDSIVWLPERSVLFSGDLIFNGGTPFLLTGSVEGTIDVLRRVIGPLAAETIVPGHGPVCGPEAIPRTLAYLEFVLDVARRGIEAGATPLQAARDTGLGPFADWLDPERIVGNLHRAYAELGGLPRGGRIDVVAALTDMVEYNGGRPLSCWA
jgi:cyclase